MDYYDIDKILAEEEKQKVTFPSNVKNFGFYYSPCRSVLKQGTKVDMPFFLTKFLVQNGFCSIVEHPVHQHKDDLYANAQIVNLENRHVYRVGREIFDREELNRIFFERIGGFVGCLIKEDFSEDDTIKMSWEEKRIILEARRRFKEYETAYFKGKDEDYC